MRKATDRRPERQTDRHTGRLCVRSDVKEGSRICSVLLASRCALRRGARRLALLTDSGESKFYPRRISE